jgi:hypothetical protein
VTRAVGAFALLSVLRAGPVEAHGDTPRVKAITFPSALGGQPLLLSDTQGVFAVFDDGFRWLCEDAIAPNASLSAVLFGPESGRMVFAADVGVFVSADGGCSFRPATGLPPAPVIYGLWPHPARPAEVLTAVAQVGATISTAVYVSPDAGDTFTPTGAVFPGLLRTILRAEHDPEVVYAVGDAGLSRSVDGGRSFAAVSGTIGDAPLPPAGLDLLGGRPTTPELWAVSQNASGSRLLVSTDLGASWMVVSEITDFVDSLAFDAEGRRGVLATLSGQVTRSDDGGATWSPLVNGPGPGFGCLVRGPDAALYACADPLQGAPFALARSPDFGGTWDPALTALNAVTIRWDCPADTPGTTACADLCPGLPRGATCTLTPADGPAPDATTAPDTGPSGDAFPGGDAGPEAQADAEPNPGRGPDAAVTHPSTTGGGGSGCAFVGPRRARDAPWPAVVALATVVFGRRRRQGVVGVPMRASTKRSPCQT